MCRLLQCEAKTQGRKMYMNTAISLCSCRWGQAYVHRAGQPAISRASQSHRLTPAASAGLCAGCCSALAASLHCCCCTPAWPGRQTVPGCYGRQCAKGAGTDGSTASQAAGAAQAHSSQAVHCCYKGVGNPHVLSDISSPGDVATMVKTVIATIKQCCGAVAVSGKLCM